VVLSGPMTPGVAAANRSPGGVIVGSETSGIKCAYYVKIYTHKYYTIKTGDIDI